MGEFSRIITAVLASDFSKVKVAALEEVVLSNFYGKYLGLLILCMVMGGNN